MIASYDYEKRITAIQNNIFFIMDKYSFQQQICKSNGKYPIISFLPFGILAATLLCKSTYKMTTTQESLGKKLQYMRAMYEFVYLSQTKPYSICADQSRSKFPDKYLINTC